MTLPAGGVGHDGHESRFGDGREQGHRSPDRGRSRRAGLRVAVGARDDDRREAAVAKLRRAGADVTGVRLDVTSDVSVAAAVAVLEERVDHLDAVVHNVGVSGPTVGGTQDPLTADFDVLHADVEANVLGAMRVTTTTLPLLRRSTSPRIVNVSTSKALIALQTGPRHVRLRALQDDAERGDGAVCGPLRRDRPRHPDQRGLPRLRRHRLAGFAGSRTAAEGAAIARFATLPDDGPTGGFYDDNSVTAW